MNDSEKTYLIEILRKDLPEPVRFGQVSYMVKDGFIIIEGLWDTHLVNLDEVIEVRIVKKDYSMALNYTAQEYKNLLAQQLNQQNDQVRNRILLRIHNAINDLKRVVLLPAGFEEHIERANEVLRQNDFEVVRIGDEEESVETIEGTRIVAKYAIKTLL